MYDTGIIYFSQYSYFVLTVYSMSINFYRANSYIIYLFLEEIVISPSYWNSVALNFRVKKGDRELPAVRQWRDVGIKVVLLIERVARREPFDGNGSVDTHARRVGRSFHYWMQIGSLGSRRF